MIGCRSALIVLLVLLLGTLVWAAQRPPAPAPGAPDGAASAPPGAAGQGQLAILGRDGRPARTCPLQHTAVVNVFRQIAGNDEVEQSVELPFVILDRRAGQADGDALLDAAQGLVRGRVGVLDGLHLIEHHQVEAPAAELLEA